jgi:hypothetical protein
MFLYWKKSSSQKSSNSNGKSPYMVQIQVDENGKLWPQKGMKCIFIGKIFGSGPR